MLRRDRRADRGDRPYVSFGGASPPKRPGWLDRRGGARSDTTLSIGTGIAGQGSILVTGIIAARALGVGDRGHFAFIFLVAQVLAVFGQLGVPAALTYFIASGPAGTKRLVWATRHLIWSQFVVVTLVQAGILLALFGSDRTGIKVAAVISLSTSGIQVLQSYGLCVLQGLRRFWSFNILRLSGPALYALLAAVAFVLGDRSLVDMTIVYSVAYVVAGVATVLRACQFLFPVGESDPEEDHDLHEVVRFGLKGMLGATAPTETFKIDQSIVGLFLSPASLGLYVSAVSFTNLPRFIAQSVGMVAYPYVARQRDERSRRKMMWRFALAAALVCTLSVVVLELTVAKLVPFMFGSAFSAAIPVSRVLLIAGLFIALRRILSDGSRGIGKPGIGSIAEFASLALLVPCLLFSVQYGLLAVGWGLTGGAFGSFAVILLLLRGGRRSAPAGQPSAPAGQPVQAAHAEG
jgi:O-antigen/teichoic acid export membrane protein